MIVLILAFIGAVLEIGLVWHFMNFLDEEIEHQQELVWINENMDLDLTRRNLKWKKESTD